jgi:hypothetical protein
MWYVFPWRCFPFVDSAPRAYRLKVSNAAPPFQHPPGHRRTPPSPRYFTWAAAFEFWRGRSEPLVSRWPAIFMLFAHGALYLLRTPLGDALYPAVAILRSRSGVMFTLDSS